MKTLQMLQEIFVLFFYGGNKIEVFVYESQVSKKRNSLTANVPLI